MKKIICILMLFLLCGCKDYVEIENLTIATAVSVDKSDDDLYLVNIEVIKFNDTDKEPVIIEASGVTYPEAITEAIKIAGGDIYFSHTQAIIISEEIARDGVYSFMDYGYRTNNLRLDMSYIIAKNCKAKEILQASSLTNDISGMQIKKILESNNFLSEVPTIPVYEFIDDVSSSGICGSLNVFELIEDSNGEKLRNASGRALFVEDKLETFLNAKDTKTLGVLKNKSKTGRVINEYDQNTPTYNLLDSKSVIKPIIKDGKLSFEIFLEMDLELAELSKYTNKSKEELEIDIQNAVHKDVIELIEKQKELYKTDFFGFGDLVYRNYPSAYKSIENTDFLKYLDYTLEVKCEIKSTGLVLSPIIMED